MTREFAVQQTVLGELLPDIGRKNRSLSKDMNLQRDGAARAGKRTPGGVGLIRNSQWVPQSVVKRVSAGGVHNAKELGRQMNYIMRDEANVASWSNQIGIERSFGDEGVASVVADWSQSWAGAPKRGHTDHIILSFPRGTDAETAEAVAREWGHELFASGYYDDRFRYVAALHHNTEHVHAHFIVDKVGMDHGSFLSISRFSEINYDSMRELHVEIASRHDLALNATSRLSRGIIENAPRDTDIQAARREGREPHIEPLSIVERAKREAAIKGFAAQYRVIEGLAKMNHADDPIFWNRVLTGVQDASERLTEGKPLMNDTTEANVVPSDTVDPAGRFIAARESLVAEAQTYWDNIQSMVSSAEKVELERQFDETTKATVKVLGESDFFRSHVTPIEDGKDPYFIAALGGLAERARDPDYKHHAQADSAANDFRAGIEEALLPFANRLEVRGTSREEVAARFAASDRTEAQLEASRPDNPTERAEWMKLEQEMQRSAEQVAATIPIGRDLQEDMAREQLLDSRASDRLADIAALDRLVTEVRADMSDQEMDRVTNGQLDPLMDRIRDPGVRQAVSSELSNVAAAEEAHREVNGRDSESAATYKELVKGHERAADRAHERSLDRDDRELEL